MPMDFCYTTESEDPSIYHVLFLCPEATKIEAKHRQYGRPPAEEGRGPCRVCLDTIDAWLSEM
jgi:hypothetical protein